MANEIRSIYSYLMASGFANEVSVNEAAAAREGRRRLGRKLLRGIDKSVLAVAAPRRYRDREHLRYVSKQAYITCSHNPSAPHHLRFTQPRALS